MALLAAATIAWLMFLGRLRQGQRELERRVAERTSELSRANDSLQMEVSERRRAEESLVHARAMRPCKPRG